MRKRVAVGRVLHGEIPALYDALKALSFGFASDIYFLTSFKSLYSKLRAHFRRFIAVGQTEFPKASACRDSRLGELPCL